MTPEDKLIHTLTGNLIQVTTKLTRKEAHSMAEYSDSLQNIFPDETYNDIFYPYNDITLYAKLRNALRLGKYGKPLLTMPDWESNPGLWLFKNPANDDTIMIWSDTHRKNAYKGTSFEVVLPVKDINALYSKFIDMLKSLD